MSNIQDTISDRQSKYGEYREGCEISSQFMKIVKSSVKYSLLTSVHEEALHMIFVKISRMLSGDTMNPDNAHDIAGYALLLEKYIRDKNEEI